MYDGAGDFHENTQRYRKKIAKEKNQQKQAWKNFRTKNEYGKRQTETSEISLLLLRPHFNLFSVPYILN